MSTEQEPFQLTISLNVLEHLGINLYSNVPAVLSEIVANAWDADASEVRVTWDRTAGRIVIQDDGVGMTPKEINERFLSVGYRRRDGQPGTTPKGRHPMGRKGIGKLSLFSIANTVRIETINGGIKSAFQMKIDEICEQIRREGGSGTCEPTILPADRIDFPRGTRITPGEIRRRHTLGAAKVLKEWGARRFSSIGWTCGAQKDIIVLCSNEPFPDFRGAGAGGLHHALGES